MKKNNMSDFQLKALRYSALFAAVFVLFLAWQFFAAIVAACITAVVFVPINEWLKKKTGKPSLSIMLTILISIFALVIPLVTVIWVSVDQVQEMITLIDQGIEASGVTANSNVVDTINEKLAVWTNGYIQISLEQIEEYALTAARAIGQGMLNFLSSTVSGIPSLITNVIIYFYVFVALLTSHKKLLDFIRKLNPLGDEVSSLFMSRAEAMTNSMVKGQFVVALAQGLVGAASVQLAGIGYFSFFALLLSVLSIVPLGGGIITIPLGVVLLLFGNISGGLLVLLTHFVIVTNIDNIIRPKLVPKDLSLNPAITMVAVFAGLSLFGFLGIVVGPVLFILALTTLQVYTKLTNEKDVKIPT
jgi:predicted PurR-regulated permease PerM